MDGFLAAILNNRTGYFQNKTGVIVSARFRSNPYFINTRRVEKVEENEYTAYRGQATTCSFDHPHYCIGAKRITMVPADKIQMREGVFYVGKTPVLYLPRYNHSLKDAMMHVQVQPGKNKDWGPYMLSAWRYDLTDNMSGRVYLDFRQKLGWAEGFGTNYKTDDFGKGDLKVYYTGEKPKNLPDNAQRQYDRGLVRWRHKWDIDPKTTFVSELYKISDEKRKKLDTSANFLKDYFYREYEKDVQPLSYALFHRNFNYSSFDVLFQKRTNPWYDQLEKLPEVKYSMPNTKLWSSPFYFENSSTFAVYDKKALMTPVSADDVNMTRFDMFNKFSMPFRLAFFELTPFAGERLTIYDKDSYGKSLPVRATFYSGLDLSTKFYRTFDVKSNLFGMDIEGLRHVINPFISYVYNHEPSISYTRLKQIDEVDALRRSNAVNIGLSNKLQTKREGRSVDLLEARVSTDYIFKQKSDYKNGGNLSDILLDLKFLPFSWLRLDADATFKRSVSRSAPDYNKFSTANYDLVFDLGKDRSFGFGQRYERGAANQLTSSLHWRFSPKWKFSMYHRFNTGKATDVFDDGLLEQEYTFTRDMHCWEMDLTLNSKKSSGSGIWVTFRLKAFPEMEFGFNQSYHSSKSGSQQD